MSEANNNFLIGPVSSEGVSRIDGLLSKNRALLLNDAKDNFSISLSQKAQISTLQNYLKNNNVRRLGFIEDQKNNVEQIKAFKSIWFNAKRDAVTIEAQNKPSNRIENFLDVSDSKARFKIIDKASFSDVEFIPRTRKDFSQIVVFTEELSRLYEIASLIRLIMGLTTKSYLLHPTSTKK